MKLTVLADNNTFIDEYYVGEPALCFYIEDGDSRILFDTGYSDVFIRNAKALGIDLSSVDTIVFSHGHNDHTRGMTFLGKDNLSPELRIIAHPEVFNERFENDKPIGAPLSMDDLKRDYTLTLSKEPVVITPRLTFLGEIPTYLEFEKRNPIGVIRENSAELPDLVMDDSAMVYNTGEGLFIITGCSHSGICNIVEHAKRVCREERIKGIIGGFHLFGISDKLQKTVNYFQQNTIYDLYPCHCVSFAAKAEIHRHIPIHEVGVGLSIEID